MKTGDIVTVHNDGGANNYAGRAQLVSQYPGNGYWKVEILDDHEPSGFRAGDKMEFEERRLQLAAPEVLPVDSAARKDIPITTGVFDYFPAALAEVAKVSKAGNDKHNPGQPLHWARGKSTDQADAIGRHLLERGGIDPETGQRYSAQMAWRALALLQLELEEAGEAPMARGAGV